MESCELSVRVFVFVVYGDSAKTLSFQLSSKKNWPMCVSEPACEMSVLLAQ